MGKMVKAETTPAIGPNASLIPAAMRKYPIRKTMPSAITSIPRQRLRIDLRYYPSIYQLIWNILLAKYRLTDCVTRWWVGRDEATLT